MRHDHDHDRRPPNDHHDHRPVFGLLPVDLFGLREGLVPREQFVRNRVRVPRPHLLPGDRCLHQYRLRALRNGPGAPVLRRRDYDERRVHDNDYRPGAGVYRRVHLVLPPDPGVAAEEQRVRGQLPVRRPRDPVYRFVRRNEHAVRAPAPPPRPYCAGGCRWVWVTPENYWYKLSDSCAGVGVPNCYCDRPAPDGTECAEEASTLCYVHGSPTGSPPCSAVTTTTGGPGSGCEGTCLWGSSSGASWDTILRACPACDCAPPVGAPTGTCSQAEGPCVPGVTTTTPGATTTTAGTCGNCTYQCNHTGIGYHYVSSACGAGCGCPDIVVDSACAPGSFRALACRTDGTTPGPTTTTTTTTTTPAPTTTTTTTSPGPPATTTTSGGGTTTPGGGGSTATSGGGGTTTPGGPSYFCQTCENGSPNFCSGVIVCTVIGAHYTMIDCVANCQTPPGTSTFLT